MALACLWRVSLDMTAMKVADIHIAMKELYFGNPIKKYVSQAVQLEKGMGSKVLKTIHVIHF
jgi:hypothetical protein